VLFNSLISFSTFQDSLNLARSESSIFNPEN
jgi:hypothetical protein